MDVQRKVWACFILGIFRVPGDADQGSLNLTLVTDLRIRIERDNYDLSGITDANVPGSLFKFWLRDLTDPLVPPEHYDYCIHNAEDVAKATEILQMIPEINRNVLLYLIYFLQVVAKPENQPVTRMSINNISMVSY